MKSRRVESFLLRVVVDDGDVSHHSWHGRIQHVSSGCEQQFDHFQDMLTFISNQLRRETPRHQHEHPLASE